MAIRRSAVPNRKQILRCWHGYMANVTFVPAPPDTLRSESGGMANVGYDRFDRKGLILWREAGCGIGEEYARHETMRRERRAAEPPRSVSKMQSAVTNGAASRAHRILDAAISAGLAPEGNLAIAERGKGRRNRPYKCGSTVAPFVTAIYNSIKASSK